MSKPQKIDDKFAQAVLALEEAIFEFEDLLENQEEHCLKNKDVEDLITSKELAESSRDLIICVIASVNGKKRPPVQKIDLD